MHSGYLLLGQRLRQRLDLLPYITVVYGMAALLVLIAAVATQQSFTGYAPATYLVMILLAFGPQLLGHTAYNWTLRYVSAAVSGSGDPRRARGRKHSGLLHTG